MFLLLYVESGQTFDIDELGAAFAASECATTSHASGTIPVRYEYRIPGDVTTIEISDDCKSIVIDGMGPASLAAAIDIQRFSSRAFRIVDDSYTFDLALSEFASPKDLYEAIIRAGA